MSFFTTRQRSCKKVMFQSFLCVIQFTWKGGGSRCDHCLWCYWSVTSQVIPSPRQVQTCSLGDPTGPSSLATWGPTHWPQLRLPTNMETPRAVQHIHLSASGRLELSKNAFFFFKIFVMGFFIPTNWFSEICSWTHVCWGLKHINVGNSCICVVKLSIMVIQVIELQKLHEKFRWDAKKRRIHHQLR